MRPLVIIVALVLSLIAGACGPIDRTSPIQTPSNATPQPGPQPPPTSPPLPRIDMDTSFPHGAPALNREARLIVTVSAREMRAKSMRANLRLPEGFELVSGNLSWMGDVAQGNKVDVITAIVRAVKEGSWTLWTTFYIDPKEHGFFGTPEEGARFPIYVLISESSAEWRLNPPYDAAPLIPQPVRTP